MPEGLNNNQIESEKMTPQKMVEEIKRQYKTSRAFVEEIINAGKDNWAYNPSEPGVTEIVVQLAQFYRAAVESRNILLGLEEGEEKENKMYAEGLWLGTIAVAIYHGEITLIGSNGELLKQPIDFPKQ